MSDVYSLYPGPNQQNQGGVLSGNPLQAIGAIGELQRIGITAQQAPALGQIPGLEAQSLQTGIQTQQMQLRDSMRKVVWGALGNSISSIPNPQADDVHNAVVNLTRAYPQIATQAPDIFNSASDALLNGGGIKQNAAVMMNSVMAPEAAATRVQGPPTAAGASQSQPLASANAAGTQPIGVPPGFAERATGGATIDTALAGNLANAAESSPARIGMLGNLDNDLQNFTSGPGADWTRVGKAWVNRNLPLPDGWKFDPGSIASQDQFVKQAGQLAQQQFSTMGGTGTDQQFGSAFATNPNDTLSQLGNQGIIRLLKGNEDALQAKNKAWLSIAGANPNASYRQFSQTFNNNYDPRTFQFKYMTPPERSAYVQGMDPPDRVRLMNNIGFAREQGWINF
jgi:hypothetical protein